jgi:hypothetical protein
MSVVSQDNRKYAFQEKVYIYIEIFSWTTVHLRSSIWNIGSMKK